MARITPRRPVLPPRAAPPWLRAAPLTAALLAALACSDEGTGEYAGDYYDGAPGTGGAQYRPLRPVTTPGVAGSNGLAPTPGVSSGGAGGYSPGAAGGSGFTGRAGAGGTPGLGSPAPYGSAGSSG